MLNTSVSEHGLNSQRRVPFLNLKALSADQQNEYLEAFKAVLGQAAFVAGKEVELFEKEFAQWVGSDKHAIGCANGTDALSLAARALGLKAGDEVIVPAMTFFATGEAFASLGLKIKLVDVDPGTWVMNPEALKKVISSKTKLVVPVHLYGQMAPVDAIRKIADGVGAFVIEDAAQAHGAKWKGEGVGTWGHAATYSFYPSKNLGAFGDGGAVLSKDADLLQRVKCIANHGGLKKYEHLEVGCNSRLDNLQAALLRVKLRHINQWNEKRRSIAQMYRRQLSGLSAIQLPKEAEGAQPVYHLFVVIVPDREKFQHFLEKKGVASGIHYPQALHQIPALASQFVGTSLSFPNAEKIAAQGVSLPMCPTLTEEDINYVCEVIHSYFQG